jgi:hypothetical protein
MTATFKVSMAATGTGAGVQLLGSLAGIPPVGWVVVGLSVIVSVAAGALAWQGHYEANVAQDDLQVRKSRRFAVMIILAQILGGFSIAAGVLAAGGSVWMILLPCLGLGWGGTGFLNKIEKRGQQ